MIHSSSSVFLSGYFRLPVAYHSHQTAAIPPALEIFKGEISLFIVNDLYSGSRLKLMLHSTGVMPQCFYLPIRVADTIPFSSDKTEDVHGGESGAQDYQFYVMPQAVLSLRRALLPLHDPRRHCCVGCDSGEGRWRRGGGAGGMPP